MKNENIKQNQDIRPRHGGEISRYPGVLDFSTSVNPYPLPDVILQAGRESLTHLERYPDPQAGALREEIARWEQVEQAQVVVGNGASELFLAMAQAFRPRRALVLAPGYSGYAYALEAAGTQVEEYALTPSDFSLTEAFLEALTKEIDLVFLADPNNPTGLGLPSALWEKIVNRCREKQIVLVRDACFADLTGREKKSPIEEGVITVCALTKILPLAGLRLGYAMTGEQDWLQRIRIQLPEWNLSLPAQEMGAAACRYLRQERYPEQILPLLETEKSNLTKQLQALGIRVFPGEANFLLIRTEKPLFLPLLQKQILVRDCSNFTGLDATYLRIAIRTPEDNKRLLAAIQECLAV